MGSCFSFNFSPGKQSRAGRREGTLQGWIAAAVGCGKDFGDKSQTLAGCASGIQAVHPSIHKNQGRECALAELGGVTCLFGMGLQLWLGRGWQVPREPLARLAAPAGIGNGSAQGFGTVSFQDISAHLALRRHLRTRGPTASWGLGWVSPLVFLKNQLHTAGNDPAALSRAGDHFGEGPGGLKPLTENWL